jgi:hypothetical protein
MGREKGLRLLLILRFVLQRYRGRLPRVARWPGVPRLRALSGAALPCSPRGSSAGLLRRTDGGTFLIRAELFQFSLRSRCTAVLAAFSLHSGAGGIADLGRALTGPYRPCKNSRELQFVDKIALVGRAKSQQAVRLSAVVYVLCGQWPDPSRLPIEARWGGAPFHDCQAHDSRIRCRVNRTEQCLCL